jgi:DNA replication and repair protein RecF
VEQGFLSQWKRYALAVRQRNSGLRRGILSSDKAWRQEIAETGTLLTQQRQAVAEKLADELARLVPALSDDLVGLEVAFRAGWDQKLSLAEALERNADSDTAQGFTQVGPHRADLRLIRDGVLAAEVLSRGQLKLALVALKLAQGVLIEDASSLSPLYLVDDLPAELDREHCARVCEQLGGRPAGDINRGGSGAARGRMGRKTAQLVPRGTGAGAAGVILLLLVHGVAVLQAYFLIV